MLIDTAVDSDCFFYACKRDDGSSPSSWLLRCTAVWVLLGATVGITNPSAVSWFSKDMFTYGLSFLMLSMGLTLTWKDFKDVGSLRTPRVHTRWRPETAGPSPSRSACATPSPSVSATSASTL